MTVAHLGFAVDSGQATAAAVDLDKLTASAGRAQSGAARLRDEFGRFVPAAKTAAEAVGAVSTANDNTARATNQLQAALDRATNNLTRHNAAAASAISTIDRLAAAEQRLNSASARAARGDDIAAYAAELDRLRAKYDPVFAVSKAYEAELNDLNRAHAVGAINAHQHGAALDRLNAQYTAQIGAVNAGTAALVKNNAAMTAHGASTNLAAFQLRNLRFQLFDVAQTAAMGMNPLMILMQQGPQIAQIYGPEEGGVARAFREMAGMMGRAVRAAGPLIVVTAVLGTGVAALRSEINETGKSAVSFGDTALAAFQMLGSGMANAFGPAISATKTLFASLWNETGDLARDMFNAMARDGAKFGAATQRELKVIGAYWDSAVATAKTAWGSLPAAIGDLTVQAANGVIDAIESMLQKAIGGLNNLMNEYARVRAAIGRPLSPEAYNSMIIGPVDLGRIHNPWGDEAKAYAEEMDKIAKTRDAAVADANTAYAKAVAAADKWDGFGDLSRRARANAGSRTAGDGSAAEDALDRIRSEIDGIRDAISAFDLSKMGDVAQAVAPWIERAGQLREAIDSGVLPAKELAEAHRLLEETFRVAATAAEEARQKLMEHGDELVRQPDLLREEIAALGHSTAAYERLMDERKLHADVMAFERDLQDAVRRGYDLQGQTIEGLVEQYRLLREETASAAAVREITDAAANDNIREQKALVGGFVSDMQYGLKRGENAWQALGDAATRALDRITDALLNDVLDALLKVNQASAGGGGGGFLGGLVGSIGGALGGLFGGGGSFYPGGGVTSAPTLTGIYANGTDYARPGLALVGERGPEIVQMRGGERVIPNHRLRAANDAAPESRGGDITFIVNDQRGANAPPVQTRESFGSDGKRLLEMTILDTVQRGMQTGALDKTLASTYGVRRRARG